jgi:thiol-disulfide isomerase/thioredoxin
MIRPTPPCNTPRSLHMPALLCTLITIASYTPDASAQQPVPPPQTQVKPAGPPWIGLVAHPRPQGQGLLIERVLRKSPAERAGLREDDILMKLGEQPLSSARDFKLALRQRAAGDTLTVELVRGGKTLKLSLTLAATPDQLELATNQLMGLQAPELSVVTLTAQGDERPTTLHNLRGKPVVLEFWATWCQPCQRLSPALNALKQTHGDRLHVLAVSAEDIATLRRDLQVSGKQYTVAHDPEEAAHDDFFVKAYPLIYILDSQHRVRKILNSATTPEELDAAVKAVMAQP